MAHLSSSNPSLPSAVLAATRPQSLPGAEHLLSLNIAPDTRGSNTTPDHHCREDYLILAKDSNFFSYFVHREINLISCAVHINLKEAVQTLLMERDRLKQAMELDSNLMSFAGSGNTQLVVNLKNSLSSALHQNQELKNRLNKIHENSDLSDVSSIAQSDQACKLSHLFLVGKN